MIHEKVGLVIDTAMEASIIENNGAPIIKDHGKYVIVAFGLNRYLLKELLWAYTMVQYLIA